MNRIEPNPIDTGDHLLWMQSANSYSDAISGSRDGAKAHLFHTDPIARTLSILSFRHTWYFDQEIAEHFLSLATRDTDYLVRYCAGYALHKIRQRCQDREDRKSLRRMLRMIISQPNQDPDIVNYLKLFVELSIFLFRDPKNETVFELSRLRSAIQGLDGINNWRSVEKATLTDDILFECELMSKSRASVPIKVCKDPIHVCIDAFNGRGLQAALDIQQQYGEEIFAFSSEVSARDFAALAAIQSPKELAEKLGEELPE